MKEQNNGGDNFSVAWLVERLRKYVEQEGFLTDRGAVDYPRLEKVTGVNKGTLRQLLRQGTGNPVWSTCEKLLAVFDKQVKVVE